MNALFQMIVDALNMVHQVGEVLRHPGVLSKCYAALGMRLTLEGHLPSTGGMREIRAAEAMYRRQAAVIRLCL